MSRAQATPQGAPNIAELDRICQRAITSRWATGVCCLLAAPKGRGITQLVHLGVMGRTAPKGGMPITKDTLFDLGTLTETVCTATLALMLVGQGRIALTTTLGQSLPWAQKGPLKACTLGQLLDHSSGLPPGRAALDAALAQVPAPVRQRVMAASEPQLTRVTTKVSLDARGVPRGTGPLDEATTDAIKAKLSITEPERPGAQAAAHTPLGPLLVGWAIEHVMGKPLDVLLQELVVKPLLPSQSLMYRRNGPQGPLMPGGNIAQTIDCLWRHRPLAGEAKDRLAWMLGGVAGHSGAFGSGDGVMRLGLGLLFSLQGMVRYVQGGALQRFWSRPSRNVSSPFTPGWQVPTRDNGMAQGRWNSRTVGQIDEGGQALFIDPAFGLVGVLLTNGDADQGEAARTGLKDVRKRLFDAMASYGQNLAALPPPKG